jgi:hypothetical protein
MVFAKKPLPGILYLHKCLVLGEGEDISGRTFYGGCYRLLVPEVTDRPASRRDAAAAE